MRSGGCGIQRGGLGSLSVSAPGLRKNSKWAQPGGAGVAGSGGEGSGLQVGSEAGDPSQREMVGARFKELGWVEGEDINMPVGW